MSDTATENRNAAAKERYENLLANFKSIILSTVDADGIPNASYAPAITDDQKRFYVLLSDLARHTGNLKAVPRASVLIIEDEGTAAQLFARQRVTFDCSVDLLSRDDADWDSIVDQMEARLGDPMGQLRQMQDFHLFRLSPEKGNLVVGFGKAFQLTGGELDDLDHRTGFGGQGHRPVEHGHGHGHGHPPAHGHR